MMILQLVLASSLLLPLQAAVTVCPKAGSIQEGVKYHSDQQCDRASYNAFKAGLGRPFTYQRFKELGGMSTVPSHTTVKCPAGGAALDLRDPLYPETGFDTVWFVENASSGPIVVSFIDKDGMERSAKNPKISPAVADPEAIVLPGRWMAVYAFEGHQFTAREVLKTGVAGNVLLQHRAGLIPIGAQADSLDCPAEDIEPIVEDFRAPEFQRVAPEEHRPCNTMDVGFRNHANCPLHVYYVSGEGESCTEAFRFHLGVENLTPDFMWEWKSKTKFEGSFIGHTFHFRLASNPAVLVDTVTLSPVVVTDCPKDGVAVPISIHGEALPTSTGYQIGSNSTSGNLYDFGPINGTAANGRLTTFSHTM